MTHTEDKPVSRNADAPDAESLDERSRRVRSEPMAVRPLDDGRYVVDGASGATYVVDLNDGTCSCPDSEIRGALCKYARRVAIEVTRGRVPPPARPLRCRRCEREVAADAVGESPLLCADCRFVPGDLAFDRERGSDTPLLVIAVSPRRRGDGPGDRPDGRGVRSEP